MTVTEGQGKPSNISPTPFSKLGLIWKIQISRYVDKL